MAFSLDGRQARRAFLLVLAGGALTLAGCQTRPGGPVGPETGPTPPPVKPSETQRNMVAVIVPLTGGDAAVGQSIANAANLALLDTGEKSIRITVYDSAGPGGAAAAASRAIGEGNKLILGPLLADDVRAAAPVARAAGVPVIAFSNDEGVAGNGVYIMGFTPDQSIGRVVTYARGRGASRFAALVPTGLYGQRAAQSMIGAVRKAGGTMGAVETFNRTPAAVTAAARRLSAKGNFDAVLVGDSGRIAAVAAPGIKTGTRVLGTELWASDNALGKTAALRGAWYAAPTDVQFDKLTARYRARYGRAPFRLASLGYDAVLLAVRSARSWPTGKAFPAKSLVDPDGFAGVDGSFRFGRDGIADRLLEVRQVTATGETTVSPAANRF
ncbi:penicillin-binding protein activator [Sphingomonas jaspsi]|uniref:penicillin-binding protein activator n=1 Tax=Sphingomonas jaspsi TaxID=392409 RepID=UPI0004B791A8|nr:penicillin-binding protein activator [Sphingomonas jaspsi]